MFLGGEIVSTFGRPELVRLGECKVIEEVMIGEDKVGFYDGLRFATFVSIVCELCISSVLAISCSIPILASSHSLLPNEEKECLCWLKAIPIVTITSNPLLSVAFWHFFSSFP